MQPLNDLDIEVREDYQSYIAEVPEIPGCSASGATEREAVENLKRILSDLELN